MVWESIDGVWRVEVRQRAGRLHGEIRMHGGLVWSGALTASVAHAELDAALAGLDGPRLEELVELG